MEVFPPGAAAFPGVRLPHLLPSSLALLPCVSVSRCPLLIAMGAEAGPLTSSWSHLQRPYFQIMPQSQARGVGIGHIVLGDSMQPTAQASKVFPEIQPPCRKALTL